MKLYHGTSSRHLKRVKHEGIKPRGQRKGNWQHTNPSRTDVVYLTNAYAVFYANAAARGNDDLIVLEVDTEKLNPFAFGPDEDFLEQALRGKDRIPGDMKQRTKWYRDNLLNYIGSLDQAQRAPAMSLEHLGNCVYFGEIPREAISRIATISTREAKDFVFQCFDPCIVLMNYAILGVKYRNAMRWLFEAALEEDPNPSFGFKPPATRAGINLTAWMQQK